jgi:hypothetical protein
MLAQVLPDPRDLSPGPKRNISELNASLAKNRKRERNARAHIYVKATGRQGSVYLETYFITLYSLFARLSRGIPGYHELTSIRYAIFAPGSTSIPHGALILKTIFYSGRCCTHALFLYVSPSSHPCYMYRGTRFEYPRQRNTFAQGCYTNGIRFPACLLHGNYGDNARASPLILSTSLQLQDSNIILRMRESIALIAPNSRRNKRPSLRVKC